jgi:hypothetical protein
VGNRQAHKEGKTMEKDQTLLLGETQLCLDCDQVKPLERGEAVVRFGAYIEFTCYQCKENKMNEYKMQITFKADRALTDEELDLILSTCEVQVMEPVDNDGNNADFNTYIQAVNIEKVEA